MDRQTIVSPGYTLFRIYTLYGVWDISYGALQTPGRNEYTWYNNPCWMFPAWLWVSLFFHCLNDVKGNRAMKIRESIPLFPLHLLCVPCLSLLFWYWTVFINSLNFDCFYCHYSWILHELHWVFDIVLFLSTCWGFLTDFFARADTVFFDYIWYVILSSSFWVVVLILSVSLIYPLILNKL